MDGDQNKRFGRIVGVRPDQAPAPNPDAVDVTAILQAIIDQPAFDRERPQPWWQRCEGEA